MPGNTIASFERAVAEGVDMVELDVLRPRDGGQLVVAHDWHDAAMRRAHSLEEALDAFTRPPLNRVEIDCDLKLPGGEQELVAALSASGLLGRAMVSTMYPESLLALRAIEPDLRRGWTYPKVIRPWDRKRWARPAVLAALVAMRRRLPALARARIPELGAQAVWAYHPLITPRLVEACRARGAELIAWTVDEPDRIARLRRIGVDGICSNDPRLLV